MIVRERPNLLKLFFIMRGSVVQRIWPQCLFVVVLSTAIVWAHAERPGLVPTLDGLPFTLIGIALSVFLGFRNSACYDRWWEARKQWGAILADARDLARQTLPLELSGPDGASARRILLLIVVDFVAVLASQLRGKLVPGGATSALSSGVSRFPAEAELRRAGLELARLNKAGSVSDIHFQILDATFSRLNAAAASCERIRATPVPFGYTLLLHRTAYLFCLLLPFGFADVLGWATPFFAGLVAYTFFGLDAMCDEMEEPFGTRANAVPIDAMSRIVAINLMEALGETELPPMPKPVDMILL
ncbi:bestrophin family protein [Ancylobacter sp. 6x-1]|uniref:Bestrophin family protein n=1 Tax=Ancylobacter crimeensis TaxID=2579147 RepID=A0ABT0DFG1_9HYPH|nr:bestrophin family protein [Ancylobacter crimeensis]MCK0198702.1 bestrophin family protein [Ancylobacter crimeensis]